MSSPSRTPGLPFTTNTVCDDDGGLTQSLHQLSLEPQPAPDNPSSPRLKTALPACPRRASRSPSDGQGSRASRTGTPPILRKASANSLHSANGTVPPRAASRRTSSAQVLSPTAKTAPSGVDEKPPVTASSVASNYFQCELAAHHDPSCQLPTETIVVLNDAVYGHRYSRPRTSRSSLSTIVERPERIRASVLGVSAAYVRLGGRHSEGSIPIHPKRDAQAIPSIPFRIHKTTRRVPLTSQAVTNVHGTKWMDELKLMCDLAESKLAMGGKELLRTEASRSPDGGPPQKLHEGDLYLCSESLEAIEGALGAVCQAVDAVFTSQHRRAFVGVRPPGHHCSASHPSGFCWINNVHVGIMHAVLAHGLTHAAIIDFDLHHGDGSQAIAWQHNSRAVAAAKNASTWKKTSIGYFSLHGINSYPCEMGEEDKVKNASLCIDNAHGQTVWNVHLESWKTEQEFWHLYESKYAVLLEKTRNYLRNQASRLKALNQVPKAAIFFSAGFDASEWESDGMQRHQVNVPTNFYARIAEDVTRLAAQEGLHVDGRVISVLEGGYSDRALFSGVFSHLSGLVGHQVPAKTPREGQESAWEMGQSLGAAQTDSTVNRHPCPPSSHQYDPSWWASAELDKLERPPELPSPQRRPRNATPTYSSPTQAFTAKAVDPVNMRRSLSGIYTGRVVERPATPPPPEVPWVVAAHELTKLLIPTERQTESCKPEYLNAEATRARRDRQSNLMGLPPPPAEAPSRPTSRMGLRGRRARAIGAIDEEAMEQAPKTHEQTAVASMASSPPKPLTRSTPSCSNPPQLASRTSRRRSVASTALGPTKEEPSQAASGNGISRPSSAMSSGTQSGSKLVVKKSRTTTGPRKEAAARAARSLADDSTSARKSRAQATAAQRTRHSTALSAPSDGSAEAMDGITTGMKKIKINLITPSQREAKERARLEATRAAPQTGGNQPAATCTGQQLPGNPSPDTRSAFPALVTTIEGQPAQPMGSAAPFPAAAAASCSSGTGTPVEETPQPTVATPDPHQCALPGSSPGVPDAALPPASNFIPYQPKGPIPLAVPQQESLTWLPANVSTLPADTPVATSSPTKEQQGTLFRYTSGIPFAPRPRGNAPKPAVAGTAERNKTEDHQATSVWEVPETPQK